MATKAKLIEVLDYGRAEVRSFVDALSDEQRMAAGSVDHWAAKDVLAHFTEWTTRLVNDFELAAANGKPERVRSDDDNFDESNAEIFTQHQHESWEQITGQLERTLSAVRAYAMAATEQEVNDSQPVPWREDRPLWRTLVGSAVEHPLLHLGYYHIGKGNLDEAARLQQTLASRMLDLDDSPNWRGTQVYNLACIEALSGQTETALAHLAEAFQLAPGLIEWSKEDVDLAGLRQLPEYQALYAG